MYVYLDFIMHLICLISLSLVRILIFSIYSFDVGQGRLKDVVQEWVGVPIEQTDMYGVRRYETGARLLTHVDRITTHAVSLIVNIAQGNLTAPWTVEVYDHANRLHEVVMEPGDIVYYESAKSLHGRNAPLAGGYYANIFTHYRPSAFVFSSCIALQF